MPRTLNLSLIFLHLFFFPREALKIKKKKTLLHMHQATLRTTRNHPIKAEAANVPAGDFECRFSGVFTEFEFFEHPKSAVFSPRSSCASAGSSCPLVYLLGKVEVSSLSRQSMSWWLKKESFSPFRSLEAFCQSLSWSLKYRLIPEGRNIRGIYFAILGVNREFKFRNIKFAKFRLPICEISKLRENFLSYQSITSWH